MIDLDALSEEQQYDEAAACSRSAWYFLTTYGWVLDPDRGTIRFEPWPYLQETLASWLTYRRTVELKARQLGISWLAAGLALWTARFQTGATVLETSIGEREAADLLAKSRFLENHLPDWLQSPRRGKDNDSELAFPGMDSRIVALPSTAAAGRSYSASLLILDEYAYHANADENLTAMLPTLTTHGRALAVSSANGYGNNFQRLWDDAPGNGWHPHFLNWRARPGRDEDWLAEKSQELGLSADKLKQEYPETAGEAFLASGRAYFRPEDVEAAYVDALRARSPGRSFRGLDRYPLQLYRAPDPSGCYLVGADPAEGRVLGDASCGVVLDLRRGEEVAHLHGQIEPGAFGDALDSLARVYPGLVAVERNNHGHAVLLRLRQLSAYGAPYTLYETVVPEQTPTANYSPDKASVAGWLSTAKSKPLALDELEEALRQRVLRLSSTQLKQELLAFRHLDGGKAGAPDGAHDDCVLATAIAWQMRHWLMQHRQRLPAAGGLATSYAVSGVG